MSDTTTVSPPASAHDRGHGCPQAQPTHSNVVISKAASVFAAWLKRSPDTATPDEVRGFQLHLIESGTSICNRNRIMTGVRFLFRVTPGVATIWRPRSGTSRSPRGCRRC